MNARITATVRAGRLAAAIVALAAGLLMATGMVIATQSVTAAGGVRARHARQPGRHVHRHRHLPLHARHPHRVSTGPTVTKPGPAGPGSGTTSGPSPSGTQTATPTTPSDTGGSPAPPAGSTTPAPPPPPPPSRTGVDEQEYSIYPSHNPVAAGSVEFDVQNLGMDDHDLTITDAAGTKVYGQVYVAAGQAAQLIATLPAGSYRLFCSLYNGAHDRAGMHASLVVK